MRKCNINNYIKWILIIGGIYYSLQFFDILLFKNNQTNIELFNFNINKDIYLVLEFMFATFCILLGIKHQRT